MIDATTNEQIRISTDGDAGPYIMVPCQQLEAVRAILDGADVPYWVDEMAVSLDERPAIVVINLGRSANPEAVQNLLDAA